MTVADDRGSGSLLGLAVIGTLVAVVLLTLPLYMGLAARASLADAADAAALGAADVASGLAPGSPCATAAHIAAANSAVQSGCLVDGLVVTTRENRSFLGLEFTMTATAGPPEVGTN
jgi:secretion/DNA translocation related TadE-like protein